MQLHELGHSIPAFPGFPSDIFSKLCELQTLYAFKARQIISKCRRRKNQQMTQA